MRDNAASLGAPHVTYDRESTLAAIDHEVMVRLADELLGPHSGTIRSPSWPCPQPDHSQTGRTPPVTVFTDRHGDQRWKCHGCGAGGTAIDMMMQARGMSVREALGELSRRTRTPPLAPGAPRPRLRPRDPLRHLAPAQAYVSPFLRRAIPSLDRYVQECADALWRAEGRPMRRWLAETRSLPEEILRLNRIGADLGPARQERPDGVPKARRAVVLPVLVEDGACYVQLRTLNTAPGFPKYLNSRESFAPNPRLAAIRPGPKGSTDRPHPEVLITEGIIDALSAAGAGYRSYAILGAGYPDRVAAVAIARLPGRLVLAFDADHAGQAGAERLRQLLSAQRREAAVLRLPPGNDLNTCAVNSADWPTELAARVEHATYPLQHLPPALVER